MISNEIIQLFKNSKRIMVFTGAGMSTDSGIPDFRSKEGLYNLAPEKILSKNFFFTYPEHFYDFFFEKLYHPEAKPNKGHQLLSKWEEKGIYMDIVTQNIDGLHSLAGNQQVIEFHGTIHTATCYNPKCQKKYTVEELVKRKEEMEEFFVCDCGPSGTRRYIKPDFVLFDEKGKWMSEGNLHDIRSRIYEADLVLVLGSSLKVYPFRSFIDNKPYFKPMVIINKDLVYQENMTNTFAIHDNISDVLAEINEYM